MKDTIRKNLCLLGMLFAFPVSVYTQSYYRVEASFTIKENFADSLSRLTMGTVYFDKGNRKIVYNIRFPEPEMWVMEDSVIYKQTTDSTSSIPSSPGTIDMSIFNLILSDEMGEYGMAEDTSLYIKASVEKVDGMVISTWKPGKRLEGLAGDIQIARRGKLLEGIIFKNLEGEILSRQHFRKYSFDGGLPFPTEIIQVLIHEGVENYRITTFKDIQFNAEDSEGFYSYRIEHPDE